MIGGVKMARESGAPECHGADCTPGPYARFDSFVVMSVSRFGLSPVCLSEMYTYTYGVSTYTVKIHGALAEELYDVVSVVVKPPAVECESTDETGVNEFRTGKPGPS